MRRGLPLLLCAVAAACYPTTTRPAIAPLPQATQLELDLLVPDATRFLASALDADSIPVARTEPRDGWLETDWFDAATLQPTTRRAVGPEVVKVRAWADPGRPDHSQVTIEVVHRPFADPSRDGRLLERQVPASHPVAKRVAAVMEKLRRAYGDRDSVGTE